MTTACIVQARITSTRLPGKVMYPLGGEPVIRHVLRRAQQIPGVDKVICAVPYNPESRVIAEEAWDLNIKVVFGPEHDVLERYWIAASGFNNIVRITADCPLIDPILCGAVLHLLMTSDAQYVTNALPRNCDKGLDCEAFTFEALALAHKTTEIPYDREHTTPWMQRNLKTRVLPGDFDPAVNLCLDTPEDYIRLKGMFNEPIPGSKRL